MILNHRAEMAIFVILSFSCYLRPSECIRLRGASLVPPQPQNGPSFASWGLILHDADLGIAGKTRITDESVLVDLDTMLWPCLRVLHEKVHADEAIWNFSLDQLRDIYSTVMERLKVTNLLMTHLYGLRHGGASYDLLARRRSLAEVKFRGRWQADTSLRRYAKATRLQREMAKVIPRITEFATNVEEHFHKMIISVAKGKALPFEVPPELLVPL